MATAAKDSDNVVSMLEAKAPARPLGYRVLLRLRPTIKKVGSVFLPDSTEEAQRELATIAQVVELGPAAFNEQSKFEGDTVKVGDWVLISKYNGARIDTKAEGPQYRVVNDDEILAVITDPDAVKGEL